MKVETNALVLLKKESSFSIAIFLKKMIYGIKESMEKVKVKKMDVSDCKIALEAKTITTKILTKEQIKLLEELYQKQIQEIEHQIKLIETRNQMCRFRIRVYEKDQQKKHWIKII